MRAPSSKNWPLLTVGFRPFFLLAAVYASVAVPLWVAAYIGYVSFPEGISPDVWHAHEMLFGITAAIVAGFLLTATPNWTGRLPISGLPLLGLVLLWLASRLGLFAIEPLGFLFGAILSSSFLLSVLFLILREIIASGNYRNLVVATLFGFYTVGQVASVISLQTDGDPMLGWRIGLAALVALITVVGGRVTPSFTGNWLRKRGTAITIAPFGTIDKMSILISGLALIGWVLLPVFECETSQWIGILFMAAAVMHLVRQSQWRPHRIGAEPLVLILHIGYAFVPAGFLVAGLAALNMGSITDDATVHVWAIGAVATMSLAIMTRASRGHTGRTLTAPMSTVTLYVAIVLATAARFLATLWPDGMLPFLILASAAWVYAFFGFLILYGPMLIGRRHKSD